MDTTVVDTTNWVVENARVWAHVGFVIYDWVTFIPRLLFWMCVGAVGLPTVLWAWDMWVAKKKIKISEVGYMRELSRTDDSIQIELTAKELEHISHAVTQLDDPDNRTIRNNLIRLLRAEKTVVKDTEQSSLELEMGLFIEHLLRYGNACIVNRDDAEARRLAEIAIKDISKTRSRLQEITGVDPVSPEQDRAIKEIMSTANLLL